MEMEKENKKKKNGKENGRFFCAWADSLLPAHLTFPSPRPIRTGRPPAHHFCAVTLVCGPARPASRSRARVPPWATAAWALDSSLLPYAQVTARGD